MTPEEQASFDVEQPWGLTPAIGLGGITMRYTNDRRLLIRQDSRVAMGQNVPATRTATIGRNHKALMSAGVTAASEQAVPKQVSATIATNGSYGP